MSKEIEQVIEELKKQNPYPKDVFIEPTKEQYARFHEILKQEGSCIDAFSGSIGRRLWNYLLDKIKESLFEDAEKPEPNEFTKAQNILLKWLMSDHTGERVTVAEMHEVKKFIDSQQAELVEKDREIERLKTRLELADNIIELRQLSEELREEQLKKPRPKTGLSEEEEQ